MGNDFMEVNSFSRVVRAAAARLARQPRSWLIIQLFGVIAVGACFGCWDVQYAADTPLYVATSEMPLTDAMANSGRTLGYPFLLRAAGMLAPEYRAIPWVHLALLSGTIIFFDSALRRYGCSPWEAFLAACGVLYAVLPWRNQVAWVLTDFPGMLMAVNSIGCLFWLLGNRRSFLAWLGLAFAVFAAYSIRPAYLFLVPLVPCLGLVLSRVRWGCSLRSARSWGFAGALAVVCLVPLLAYCTLRFAVVGRFGLVSYGGYTLSGLASELVDPEIDNELPVAHRPLAKAVRDKRAELGMKSIFPGRFGVDMALFERQLSPNIFKVAVPSAKRLYGEELLVHEPELLAFSKEVIAARKAKYFRWAAFYPPRCLAKILFFEWSLWLFLPAALVLSLLGRRSPLGGKKGTSNPADVDCPVRIIAPFCWLGPAYFLASVATLCLAGSPADSRLAVPTGVFLPPLVLLWLAQEAKRVFRRAPIEIPGKAAPLG
jgi:hypothetical protein